MARPADNYVFSLIHGNREERQIRETQEIHYDPGYFKTIPGVLKCIQMVLNFLIFITIISSHHANLGRMSFLSLTGGIGFILVGVLLGCRVFHVVDKYNTILWPEIEFAQALIWTVLTSIGSIVCLLYLGNGIVFGIVPFFGIINTVAYTYDCILKYQTIKKGKDNQSTPKI